MSNTGTHQSSRCPRCTGLLIQGRDEHGAYLHCMPCGHYIDGAVPEEEPHGLASKGQNHRGGRTWQPISHACQERYRKWCAIIEEEGLSMEEAAERFRASERTIYRAVAWVQGQTT